MGLFKKSRGGEGRGKYSILYKKREFFGVFLFCCSSRYTFDESCVRESFSQHGERVLVEGKAAVGVAFSSFVTENYVRMSEKCDSRRMYLSRILRRPTVRRTCGRRLPSVHCVGTSRDHGGNPDGVWCIISPFLGCWRTCCRRNNPPTPNPNQHQPGGHQRGTRGGLHYPTQNPLCLTHNTHTHTHPLTPLLPFS